MIDSYIGSNTKGFVEVYGLFQMDTFALSRILSSLITLPRENEWVEFKMNLDNPQEIGEYISALSNAAFLHGQAYGYLVWGIDDDTHDVLGTTFKMRAARKGNQELESWLANQLRPRIDFKVYEWTHDSKALVMLKIDAARGTPVMFRGEAYIRVGTYKKYLKNYPEKARKIWKGTTPVLFETSIALDNLGVHDVFALINHTEIFDLLGLQQPLNAGGVLKALEREGVLVFDSSNNYAITNVGALLFAKRLSDFPSLANKAVRLIFYKGKNKLETEREIQGIKGYGVGFEGLISYIVDRLPQNEFISKALRREAKLYPEVAIRELVANALIHQDLTQSGTSPMIEVYEDRIEITNNGRPLIPPLRFLDETPRSRNEVLAGMMRKLRICEERGSGIDKVVAFAEIWQLPAPDFIVQKSHMKAVLYAPRSLRNMTKAEKVRACYQHACLKYVSSEQMTNATLRKRFNIPDKNYSIASRIIADALGAGLIIDYDPTNKSKRHARYVPFWASENAGLM